MEFNLASAFSAIADAYPERTCITWRGRRQSFREVDRRSDALASLFLSLGIVPPRSRACCGPSESGQDHIAIYAYNGPQWLESMIAAYKARAVPLNVNYRYTEAELEHLLADMSPKIVVVGGTFAPTLARVASLVPSIEHVIQVDDGSGASFLPGAIPFENLCNADSKPCTEPSPDDSYILYTGGTTGLPKGVLWRQADIFVSAMGGRRLDGSEFSDLDDLVASAANIAMGPTLPTAPFMHGAGQWTSFGAFFQGRGVVIQSVVDGLDPADVWDCVAAHGVGALLMIGDSFARPLLDEYDRSPRDVSSLRLVVTGGAAMTPDVKGRILERIPTASILDSGGSSETGGQIANVSTHGDIPTTGMFDPVEGTCVLSESRERILTPGHEGVGWLARSGRIPIGYLNDTAKTASTFVAVDGQRYSVPGDRARLTEDGRIELLGRDSVTINSGGEKIFAEEVEQALARHPAVYDVVVCGRPSERWGSEVVAIIQLRPGAIVDDAELLEAASSQTAKFKLPKAILRRDRIQRSPAGKADYRWARAEAERAQ